MGLSEPLECHARYTTCVSIAQAGPGFVVHSADSPSFVRSLLPLRVLRSALPPEDPSIASLQHSTSELLGRITVVHLGAAEIEIHVEGMTQRHDVELASDEPGHSEALE